MTTQLSPHFSLAELVFSPTAARLGINNTPSPIVQANLLTLAKTLELVRALMLNPMHIDSGYRTPALNRAVGGVENSAHVYGYAADFVCPGFGSPLDIVDAIRHVTLIQFDQIIFEQTWVHLSIAPAMRRQVLTAHFDAKGRAGYALWPGA